MDHTRLEHEEAFRLSISAASQLREDVQYVVRAGELIPLEEWNRRILENLPPAVAEALRRFGWKSLREDATCRAQFRDIYLDVARREQTERMRPAAVREIAASVAVKMAAIGNGGA